MSNQSRLGLLPPGVGAPYEPMTVYRQYNARTDEIELAVLFHKDGGKKRLDLKIPVREVHEMFNAEEQIHRMVFEKIEKGEYIDYDPS